MATPSCVKTCGRYLMLCPRFKVPNWNLEGARFCLVERELKHEVGWKAVEVALNGFVEVLGFNAVERSQVAVQHHPLTTDEQDGLLDLFRLNQRCLVAHFGSPAAQRVGRAYAPGGAREDLFGKAEG